MINDIMIGGWEDENGTPLMNTVQEKKKGIG